VKEEAQRLAEHAGEDKPPTRWQKQGAYLRSLQFAGVRDRFLLIRGSGAAQRKAQLAYFLIPAIVCTGLTFSHFLHISFGVYLKHQALVDCYYQDKLE